LGFARFVENQDFHTKSAIWLGKIEMSSPNRLSGRKNNISSPNRQSGKQIQDFLTKPAVW